MPGIDNPQAMFSRAAVQSVKPRRKQRKADPAFSLQGLWC
jgi:hypothetical protein